MTHTEQPKPTQGVGDMALEVISDLLVRRKVGISRYGAPLQAGNGRNAVRDAYEEALDLACYLRQIREERNILIESLTNIASTTSDRDAANAILNLIGRFLNG
jgi:hypothetical protein